MDYYESADEITISRKRALLEIRNHGVSASELPDFYAQCGDNDTYSAHEVLDWLGY